jgi:imidazolonepropionase-like amidohydrolase
MRRLIFFLALLFAAPLCAQSVAIRAGNLIDPATGKVSTNQIILVKDQKIVEVGPSVAIPAGAQVIDLSREWVMPGIMDAHTHVTYEVPSLAEPGDANFLVVGKGMRVLQGLKISETLLNAGVTTVRDVGNDADYSSIDLRNAINKGWFAGPTILTAGKIIGPYGGQSAAIPPEAGATWRFEYIDADGPLEVRKAVRENIFYGADLIKLCADNSPYHYSEEELLAAVDEAHKAGRAVAVHVYGGEAATLVIQAGVDSVEHGWFLTDEQLHMMKDKGIFLAGTDFPAAHFIASGFPGGAEKSAAAIDRLHRAYNIGVKMAFSTDIVTAMPGESRADMTWDYLAVWRKAGVPPAALLKAMTTNAAELLRIQKERGAIAAGLYADIIAMPSSPLDDTESLRKVNFVMKNGAVVRNQ